MGYGNPVVGGTNLVREAINSPNFVAGSTGWSINKDGSAEFNNIVIRGGTVEGGDALYYNGTPAFGNMVASISGLGGTDPFGNVFPKGVTVYGSTTNITMQDGELIFGNVNNPFNQPFITGGGSNAGVLALNSGLGNPPDNGAAVIGLTTGDPTIQPGNTGIPALSLFATGSARQYADVQVTGFCTRVDTANNAYNWTTAPVTLVNGWSAVNGASMFNGLQVKLTALGTVGMDGGIRQTSGAFNSGTVLATVSGIYRPVNRHMVPCMCSVNLGGDNFSACMLFPDSAGNITYYGPNIPLNGEVYIGGEYPIGV